MNIEKKIQNHHNLEDTPKVVFMSGVMKNKSVDIDENAEFSGIATKQVIDLEGEIVLADGLDWSYALDMKAMYLKHDYDEDPVAKLLSVKKTSDGWFFRGVFLKSHEEARKTHRIASELGQFGVSVGFIPMDSGRPTQEEKAKYGPCDVITRRAKVLELSVAWMPANPRSIANMSQEEVQEIESKKKYLLMDDDIDSEFVEQVIPSQKKIILLD